MKNLIDAFFIVILMSTSVSAFSNEKSENDFPEDALKVSVHNENLFLHVPISKDLHINRVVLKLNKGRKIVLETAIVENDQQVYFLDSKEAFKLKKHELVSIIWFDNKGRHESKLNSSQIEKISRSLP
jgi:hypothetical protein